MTYEAIVRRPDPRLPESWCREGVAHDHGACGSLWDSTDRRDIEEAARWADDQAAARRAEGDRNTLSKQQALEALDAAIDATERMQGDPMPTAEELLGELTRAGYAIVRAQGGA